MLNTDLILKEIDAFSASQPEESYHVHIPAEDGSPRKYLGLSALGEECERKVWFAFRHCRLPEFPPRLYRLFRRGHREEYVFVHLLRGIGLTIHTHDGEGKQFKVTDFDGHLSGHMDAVGEAPERFWFKGQPAPFLVEFKTYNVKRFAKLQSDRVEKADPKYYVQMQTYMGYEELPGALFCAVCKDTDDLYFEWVPFRRAKFEKAVAKAEAVLKAMRPSDLPRLSDIPSWWGCKFCEFAGICHGGEPSLKSCRTCRRAYPIPGGWDCSRGTFGEVCDKYVDCAGK